MRFRPVGSFFASLFQPLKKKSMMLMNRSSSVKKQGLLSIMKLEAFDEQALLSKQQNKWILNAPLLFTAQYTRLKQ